MWALPPKSDLTCYVHMRASASCWIKTTQGNGKPLFVQHLKHYIHAHTRLYEGTQNFSEKHCKASQPCESYLLLPHLAGTSQSSERWRWYHVARPPKKMHQVLIQVSAFDKNRADLTPLRLASLSHETLHPRLSVYITKNLAGLLSLLVSHSFQMLIFVKEASLQGWHLVWRCLFEKYICF